LSDRILLIAVDWGTSRLRAMAVAANGAVIEERDSEDGIAKVAAGGHEAAFEALAAGWPREAPAIMAGMVGSRQGWREAAYAPCPAKVDDLASQMLRFSGAGGRRLAIVPGVMLRDPGRDGDVIRGEETQIVGLLAQEPGFAGVVILPGTHSKWASVTGGAIADFQTYLTGELFELLSKHSFLRHSVAEGEGDLAAAPGFRLGVERTAKAGLPFLAAIFSVRVRQLLDNVDRADNLAYLSGLVIGGEIAAAAAAGRLTRSQPIRIIGTRSLARAYRAALTIAGYEAEALDGGPLVAAGLVHLASKTGMLEGNAA